MKNYIYIILGLLIGSIAYSLISIENEEKDKKELYEYTGEEFKKQSVNKNNNTQLVSGPYKRPIVALDNPKIAFLYAKIIMEELAKEKKSKAILPIQGYID